MEQLLLGVAAMVCRCVKLGNVCINVATALLPSTQTSQTFEDSTSCMCSTAESKPPSSNRWRVAKTPVYQLSYLNMDFTGSCTLGSRGTVAVLRQAMTEGEQKAAGLLKQLKERELEVQLPQGMANAEGKGDCWPVQRQVMRSY